ncbi:unnamed protein product [Trichobilharzia szidati]|nr:unnamed protein product [Trichobilharzia szidati]
MEANVKTLRPFFGLGIIERYQIWYVNDPEKFRITLVQKDLQTRGKTNCQQIQRIIPGAIKDCQFPGLTTLDLTLSLEGLQQQCAITKVKKNRLVIRESSQCQVYTQWWLLFTSRDHGDTLRNISESQNNQTPHEVEFAEPARQTICSTHLYIHPHVDHAYKSKSLAIQRQLIGISVK